MKFGGKEQYVTLLLFTFKTHCNMQILPIFTPYISELVWNWDLTIIQKIGQILPYMMAYLTPFRQNGQILPFTFTGQYTPTMQLITVSDSSD